MPGNYLRTCKNCKSFEILTFSYLHREIKIVIHANAFCEKFDREVYSRFEFCAVDCILDRLVPLDRVSLCQYDLSIWVGFHDLPENKVSMIVDNRIVSNARGGHCSHVRGFSQQRIDNCHREGVRL